GPCQGYDEELVAKLCQQASTNGPEKVLLGLPMNDARWIVVRLMDLDQRMEWAKACAERARGYADAVYFAARAEAKEHQTAMRHVAANAYAAATNATKAAANVAVALASL